MSAEAGPAAPFMAMAPGLDPVLLSQVEDAGLNASAPPQQRWVDGWLVRTCPGKAQRARCINAVAAGRRAPADKLAECAVIYRSLGLPMLVRITPFTQPPGLDQELADAGFAPHDETRVMLFAGQVVPAVTPLPAHLQLDPAGADELAEAAGQLRGSPSSERAAHAQRLREAPVPYHGFVLRQRESGELLACGQVAIEGTLAGLYDVVTAPAQRRQGLATSLCRRLLTYAQDLGASTFYLQVGADNAPARSIYARLGFIDAYGYHYRVAPAG